MHLSSRKNIMSHNQIKKNRRIERGFDGSSGFKNGFIFRQVEMISNYLVSYQSCLHDLNPFCP
jgi:hypothetical protein